MLEDDNTSKWREYFTSHVIVFFMIFVGIFLTIIGFLILFKSSTDDDKIEIIPAAQEKTSEKIHVDIEGAIEKPGVYELSLGSRVNDLLIMAGGLSAKADREWAQINLNKAQKLKDGDKIYVPSASQSGAIVTGTSITVSSKININTATLSELDVLWGIGPVTAQKIIDNRPYQQVEDLLNRKILTKSTYQKIGEKLTVY